MSNYLVMLENHLTPAQARALTLVQDAAAATGSNVFISGSPLREMFRGAAVRELEFVVEGSAAKLARSLPETFSVHTDEHWKQAVVTFDSKVEARILSARQERYAKPGARPQITPAGIHEHLRNRDFTINSIAISLAKSSKGLLLDPNNGLSDLEHRELRAVTNYALYDQPVRLFQLIRLKAQLGFAIAEKTLMQYRNAREANVEKHIHAEALFGELRQAARDPNAGAIVEAWAEEGLLARVSPALAGPKLNSAGFARLAKARQSIQLDADTPVDDLALFLWILTEKLTPRERSEFIEAAAIPKEAVESWHRLEARSGRLAKELEAASKPSRVYAALSEVPAERAIFLLVANSGRTVHERIRNYYTKYLPTALEVTDAEVTATGVVHGTPKWQKRRAEIIAKRLDARPKKPPEVTEVAAAPAAPPPPPVRLGSRSL
jgi:tRNA nucleotidyltransferase (CCA-adding enzyme)